MRMSPVLLLGLTLFAVPMSGAKAEGIAKSADVASDRLEKARSLMSLLLPKAERQIMFERVLNSMMGVMTQSIIEGTPELQEVLAKDEDLRKVFSDFLARQKSLVLADLQTLEPEMLVAFSSAYARIFTTTELDEIASFLSTATGRKFAGVAGTLLGDPDIVNWQKAIAQRAQQRQRAELEKFLTDIDSVMKAKEVDHHDS